jgi:hypothetical protein
LVWVWFCRPRVIKVQPWQLGWPMTRHLGAECGCRISRLSDALRSPTRRAWFLRRQRRPLRTDCSFRRASRPGSGINRQQRATSKICPVRVRLDLASAS